MNDQQLNDHVAVLLGGPMDDRLSSDGQWAMDLGIAREMWERRHPKTLPPAYKNRKPPPCFVGDLPPIYEGDL